MNEKIRCSWCNPKNPTYMEYHDKEWGVPNFDDKYLYKMLILESFQAGLSWECVLNKRESFRMAYNNFHLEKVCNYDNEKITELLNNKVSFCVYDAGSKKDGEWALQINSVIVFGKVYVVEDFEESMDICKKLSLKYTPDMEYIEDEIRKFGNATLCYELRPEHITGKGVNES